MGTLAELHQQVRIAQKLGTVFQLVQAVHVQPQDHLVKLDRCVHLETPSEQSLQIAVLELNVPVLLGLHRNRWRWGRFGVGRSSHGVRRSRSPQVILRAESVDLKGDHWLEVRSFRGGVAIQTTVKANSPQIRVAPRVLFIVTRSVGLWPSVGHYRDFINFPLVFHRRIHRVMDCYLGDTAFPPGLGQRRVESCLYLSRAFLLRVIKLPSKLYHRMATSFQGGKIHRDEGATRHRFRWAAVGWTKIGLLRLKEGRIRHSSFCWAKPFRSQSAKRYLVQNGGKMLMSLTFWRNLIDGRLMAWS